ncbi:MAG: hypothetical protein PHQ27_10240 [Victivallales bacterium]|nr:hypothetical protein [Victivallales bacterium]
MKTFAKLGAKTIRLTGADHRVHEVQRLSIAQIEQFDRIAETALARAETVRHDASRLRRVYREAETGLSAVLRPCLPETIAADLSRFVFSELLELGLYLAYGDDGDDHDDSDSGNDTVSRHDNPSRRPVPSPEPETTPSSATVPAPEDKKKVPTSVLPPPESCASSAPTPSTR